MDRRSNSKSSILMGKYEVGRVLGQGTFAKVYRARNIKTGQSVAIKVIDKDKILRGGLIEQLKREISVMRLVPHPNIVQLYEVMASKNKIYFAMEFVKGGELFSKVARGRLKEDAARKYFQQLVAAIEFCHSRGVYHRDLKPENLLLDEKSNLKISDFGLSALWESRKQDSLLHTTCGTPAYVAPEIITQKGYDGAKADVWSCGIVLFVLLAGYLPFNDSNLMRMYKKIKRGEFKCPEWISVDARRLLTRLLDTNPDTRITLARVMDNPWFMKGFKHIDLPTPAPRDKDFCYLSDLHSAFSCTESLSTSSSSSSSEAGAALQSHHDMSHHDMRPANYNAFDIISLSPGFDLSGLFLSECNQKLDARFTTKKPASTIVSKFEEIAETERFYINQKDESTVELQDTREGRKGQLVIDAEICEVTPSFFVVELKKTAGDTIEYKNFCDAELKPSLKDIVWTWEQENRTHH